MFICRRKNRTGYDVRTDTRSPDLGRNDYRNSKFGSFSPKRNLRFFMKPKIEIFYDLSRKSEFISENVDLRWGPLQETSMAQTSNGTAVMPFGFFPRRRFINIIAKN